MWARMAKLSIGKDDPLHKDKQMCARYWMERTWCRNAPCCWSASRWGVK